MALKIQASYSPKVTGRGWNDTANWATKPGSQVASRERLQSEHDQEIDYMNDFLNYYTDTGSANALVITPDPAFESYTTNMTLYVKTANACTNTCTINVNGLGAKSIKKNGNVDLQSGDFISGHILHLKYDGTNFQLLNQSLMVTLPAGTDYTTERSRNIILSTSDASGGSNGSIWIKYTP